MIGPVLKYVTYNETLSPLDITIVSPGIALQSNYDVLLECGSGHLPVLPTVSVVSIVNFPS